MKIEIELSDRAHQKLLRAAKNSKLSPRKFVHRVVMKAVNANQKSSQEVTASLDKFFRENPGIDVRWWNDRGWDDYQR